MSWLKTASTHYSAADSAARAARATADAAQSKNAGDAAEAAARVAEAVAEASSFDKQGNSGTQHTALLRDTERYKSDAHRIWVFKVANTQGTAVSLEIKNERDGMMIYSDYWHYNKKQENRADKTFQSLVKISEQMKDDFEKQNTPTSLVCPIIRAQTKYLDMPYREKTSLGFFNDGLINETEADWRQTIYGERYPQQNPAVIGQNWNRDEKGRAISINNKNSRSQVYEYKYE